MVALIHAGAGTAGSRVRCRPCRPGPDRAGSGDGHDAAAGPGCRPRPPQTADFPHADPRSARSTTAAGPAHTPGAAWWSARHRSGPTHDRPARCAPHRAARPADPPFPGAGRVLVRPGDRGVHADIPADQPGRIRQACSAVSTRAQLPSRCQRRNNAYTADQDPYRSGTSRHGVPTRVRHRIPSMSCRLVHSDGRPGLRPTGSSGARTAHCASVRSCRPVTATVATRSPCRWSVLVDKPPTGDLAHCRVRHAAQRSHRISHHSRLRYRS
jgi:hypothetical protein